MGEKEAMEMKASLESVGEAEIRICTLEKSFCLFRDLKRQKRNIKESSHHHLVLEGSYTVSMNTLILYKDGDEQLNVFRFPPLVVPIKCTVFPLVQNQEYEEVAKKISKSLTAVAISYKIDITGIWSRIFILNSLYAGTSIGKRYARTDELGVPFAVTVDSTTSVTIRERDSKQQIRVKVEEVASLIKEVHGMMCYGDIPLTTDAHVVSALLFLRLVDEFLKCA